MILDCICSKIVENDLQLKSYLKHSLLFHQLQNGYERKLLDIKVHKNYPHRTDLALTKLAWIDTLEIGKQASDFLIYNDIVTEELIEKKIDQSKDPLSMKDRQTISHKQEEMDTDQWMSYVSSKYICNHHYNKHRM